MVLPREIEFCTYKHSGKGLCFSRQHFTRAPLNPWEAAVVGETGWELVRVLDKVSAISSLQPWHTGNRPGVG